MSENGGFEDVFAVGDRVKWQDPLSLTWYRGVVDEIEPSPRGPRYYVSAIGKTNGRYRFIHDSYYSQLSNIQMEE